MSSLTTKLVLRLKSYRYSNLFFIFFIIVEFILKISYSIEIMLKAIKTHFYLYFIINLSPIIFFQSNSYLC